jgi:drug/metabolite transporter (DMT)-like permease
MSHLGEWAALATAVCWTITALSFESAGRRVGSLAVNFVRLVLALVPLAIYGLIRRGCALPIDASLHAWFWLALSGFVGFTLGDLFLFRGFVLVGARTTMLISMSLSPILAALFGWCLLGDQLTSLDVLGMAVTLAGVAWVVLERPASTEDQQRQHRRLGILLGVGAGVGQAGGLILGKYGMGSLDPFAASQIRVLAGAFGFAMLFFAIRRWHRVGSALGNRPAMARIALGAFFGPFLGVSLALLAIQRTATGVAATIMSLVPVFLIVPSILIFRERVTLRAVLGAMIAVGGVAVLFLQ